MSIKSLISDPRTGLQAQVDNGAGEASGLVVVTRPLKTFANEYAPDIFPFLNPIYGIDMNKDATFGGVPVEIHNGGDDALWTGSAIAGTWDFASAVQARGGAASVEGINAGSGGHAQFAKGGDQALTGYVALTGWIYITAWTPGKYLNIWCEDDNVLVGNSVNIADYIDVGLYSSWQQFQIPLDDLGVTDLTVDEIHVENQHLTNTFYLDDIQFEQTGGGIEYIVKPALGTWYHVERYRMTIADAVSADNTDSTVPHLSYDQLLGESPTNGFLFQHINNNVVTSSAVSKSIGDMLQYPRAILSSIISDGTNTFLTIDNDTGGELILKSENDDSLRITIQDNMTGLLKFRYFCGGYTEQRG